MKKLVTKRFLAMFLSAVMMFSLAGSIGAFAEEMVIIPVQNEWFDSFLDDSYYTSGFGISETALEQLKNTILNGILNCQSSITISSYGIAYTEAASNALGSLVYKGDPRFFNVQRFSMSLNYSNVITKLNITYSYSKTVFDDLLAQCDAKADEMTADIVTSGLTDVQKALLLHDRLAVLCEYDLTLSREHAHDMCGAFIDNLPVCEGYAQAYNYLMERVGIECYMVSSSQMTHAWNIVTIGGKKYHVDVTWDDPTYDMTGRVYHNNFLLSSNALYSAGSNGHVADDYDTSPTDTTYDTYFWQNVSTEFRYHGGKIYYIDDNTAKLTVWDNDTHTPLISVKDTWRSASGGYWVGNFAKLSGSSNYLYYSLTKGIYRFDTATNTSTLVYQPDLSAYSNYSIYGFKVDGEYFVLDVYNTPNFTPTTKSDYGIRYKFEEPSTEPQVIYGDLDGNDEVDTNDVYYILMIDAGKTALTDEWSVMADVNGDGEVDTLDAAFVLKYVAGIFTSFPVENK